MNKTELIAAIAAKSELSKKDSEKALRAFEEAVTEELAAGGKVQLVGFGTFDVAHRAAREAVTQEQKRLCQSLPPKPHDLKSVRALRKR